MFSFNAPRRRRLAAAAAALLLLCGILFLRRRGQAAAPPLPAELPDLPASAETQAPSVRPPEAVSAPVIESAPPDSAVPEAASVSSANAPAVVRQPADEPGALPVLKGEELSAGGTVYFRNESGYEIDPTALLKKACPVALGDSGPQVLIMHTHGTEAYTPTAAEPYTASDNYRTTDPAHNMLRVGQTITDRLNARGVQTVHSETLNDWPAYNGAYNRALADIERMTERYPSIRIIIDVHRDALSDGDATCRAVTLSGDRTVAQLLFVTGTDAGGLTHDRWRDNLTFQAQLHDALNRASPGIMRPMSIRRGRFNQHVRMGSMLLEVGTNGNTLEEALAAAEIFADTLADFLLE